MINKKLENLNFFMIWMIAATLTTANAKAINTHGMRFGCSNDNIVQPHGGNVKIWVSGLLPVKVDDNRIGFIVSKDKTVTQQISLINDKEMEYQIGKNFLERLYGKNRKIISLSDVNLKLDFVSRSLFFRYLLTVNVNGVDEKREFYLSSVPGSMLLSRNDKSGVSGEFNAVFTGPDPVDNTKQLNDFLVHCSFNDNFTDN